MFSFRVSSRRSVASGFVAALVFAIAACGDSATDPQPSAVGEYDLGSHNGADVPSVLSPDYTLLSGTMSLRADSTFVITPLYQRANGTTFTSTIAGTWSADESALTYIGVSGEQIGTGTYTSATATFVQPDDNSFEFIRAGA